MKRIAAIHLVLLLGSVFALGQAPNEARIEGSVASATNGQLLARARVFIRRSAQKDDYVTWIDADDYGRFLFKNVEPGTYEILAEKAGYYTDPHKNPSTALEVKAGDRVNGVVIRLIPLAAVSGRIRNEHDDPVQDTQVRLLAKEYLHGRELLNPVGFAVTDDRGEYRIFGVRPGNYYLVVEYDAKKGHSNPFPGVPVKDAPPELSYPPLFYPLTSDLRQAQRISVSAGAELHFDFVFLSAPSVSVEGKVVNGITGEPAKNPSVAAYWGDRITGITRKVDLPAPGQFKLDGVEPGPYTLVASMSLDGQNYSDFQVIEVGVAGLKDVQLALMPDFDLHGQVRFENADNLPQDSIPRRASVEFMPLEKNTGAFRATASTRVHVPGVAKESSLAFATKIHPGDRYRVDLPGLPQDYYLKSVLVNGHEVPTSEVAIHGNNVEIVLVASPAGGRIEGMVRNSKGEPVAGQVVLAPDVYRLAPEQVRTVRSDAQGRFTLHGIPPGNYKVYAWEQLDLNELLGQLDVLKDFEGECQLVHVDENGIYNPELKVIAGR
jgi:hypothetical protein